ncbi:MULTISPECIES: hypothetical protein [Nocardia]|uniref:hypothetical protein n=1 Tax=Nocardia TaxID=1817 RepID=UPI0003124F91|nr:MULTISPECIES: hypothetical protein [Nocardia]
MKLEILEVPACPGAAVLEQRLRQVAADVPMALEIVHRMIGDADEAAAAGMSGSPTLLIDGRDLFATPGQTPSLSCRLYPTGTGRLDGVHSAAALRAVLRVTPGPSHT